MGDQRFVQTPPKMKRPKAKNGDGKRVGEGYASYEPTEYPFQDGSGFRDPLDYVLDVPSYIPCHSAHPINRGKR